MKYLLILLILFSSTIYANSPDCKIDLQWSYGVIFIFKTPDGWLSVGDPGQVYIPDPEHKWNPCDLKDH